MNLQHPGITDLLSWTTCRHQELSPPSGRQAVYGRSASRRFCAVTIGMYPRAARSVSSLQAVSPKVKREGSVSALKLDPNRSHRLTSGTQTLCGEDSWSPVFSRRDVARSRPSFIVKLLFLLLDATPHMTNESKNYLMYDYPRVNLLHLTHRFSVTLNGLASSDDGVRCSRRDGHRLVRAAR